MWGSEYFPNLRQLLYPDQGQDQDQISLSIGTMGETVGEWVDTSTLQVTRGVPRTVLLG